MCVCVGDRGTKQNRDGKMNSSKEPVVLLFLFLASTKWIWKEEGAFSGIRGLPHESFSASHFPVTRYTDIHTHPQDTRGRNAVGISQG